MENLAKQRLGDFCVDAIEQLVETGFSGTVDLGYTGNNLYYLMPGDGYSRSGAVQVIEYEVRGIIGGLRPKAKVVSVSDIPFLQYDLKSLEHVAEELDKALKAHSASKAPVRAGPSLSIVAAISNLVRRTKHAEITH